MRKWLIIPLAALAMLLFAAPAAFAESAPPSNFQIGSFTSVDTASHTAVFVDSASGDTNTIKLAESIDPAGLALNQKSMVSFEETSGGMSTATDVSVMFLGLTLDKLIALLLVGLIGGLLSGFIGSGGAFVITPAMMSLGAPGAIAVASNMCHKFPKSMVGAYKRFRYGQVDVKLGLFIAGSSIAGVQLGFSVQERILNTWGTAGSDLYVSLIFVLILITVGGVVFKDAIRNRGGGQGGGKLAQRMQSIKIPPMIYFKKSDLRISAWVTIPVGFATGMLAATIAVGGFVGVPGMVYVVGASPLVASATELLVAFCMGMYGSIQWALAGLVDIRLVLLILAASLFGVQIGALGTTYVKDRTINLVMGTVMLIVAVSRGFKVPVYLAHLNVISLDKTVSNIFDQISFWALIAALVTGGVIITVALVKGVINSRVEEGELEDAADTEAVTA